MMLSLKETLDLEPHAKLMRHISNISYDIGFFEERLVSPTRNFMWSIVQNMTFQISDDEVNEYIRHYGAEERQQ